MRHVLACLGLLAATLVLAGPADGQGQPPAKKKARAGKYDRMATDQDYTALSRMKEAVGRVVSLDGSQQLTLKVEYPSLELKNPSARTAASTANLQRQFQNNLRREQQLMVQYQQALAVRNPAQRQRRLNQVLARMQALLLTGAVPAGSVGRNGPYKVVNASVQFQLPIMDNVKVAQVHLETQYDDKGNVVQPSPEELKKRKDPNMPGYTAKMEDVATDDLIKVYLGKSKAAEAAAQKAKDKGKAEAKDKAEAADAAPDKPAAAKDKAAAAPKEAAKAPIVLDKADADVAPAPAAEDTRPQIRMILILVDPDPMPLPGNAAAKDKKNP
jgi:hypothetical protein